MGKMSVKTEIPGAIQLGYHICLVLWSCLVWKKAHLARKRIIMDIRGNHENVLWPKSKLRRDPIQLGPVDSHPSASPTYEKVIMDLT